MPITLKAIKQDRLINLGCRNGVMIIFNPGETKTISDEDYTLFKADFERYISGRFLDVIAKGKKKDDKDLDINKDGKVDEKDEKLARKVLKHRNIVNSKTKNVLKER